MQTSRKTKQLKELYIYNTPNIAVVGGQKLQKKMKKIENHFNVQLNFVQPQNLKKAIGEKTIAIIVDEMEIKDRLKTFLNSLFRSYEFLPIFFLSRMRRSPSFYKNMYEKGLHGVIDWPKEAFILHDIMIETLKPHKLAIGKTNGDKKISEVLKSHIMLLGNFEKIKVKVIEGFAFLEGKVNSLYDKHLIVNEASQVLGVKKVINNKLQLSSERKLKEKDLELKIKMFTQEILGPESKYFKTQVKGSRVFLKGKVSRIGDLLEIEDYIMKQNGVHEIKRLAKVRPINGKNYRERSKTLENKIQSIFSGVRQVSIKIYGEIIEVSGIVSIKADRNLIEAYINQVMPFKKVVNNIYIADIR